MSAPKVDVRAVLDELVKRAEMKLPQGISVQVLAARDAAIELFEAASGPIGHPDFDIRTKANVRLAHALLRFEGREP